MIDLIWICSRIGTMSKRLVAGGESTSFIERIFIPTLSGVKQERCWRLGDRRKP
ncbi:MAG TPA: hypothetical protein VLT36_26105 [Candidatus Dormibacteraeota bacterium]|nr:hypothetical protein [Candidatus Dormibacteraeota bacterium]